MKKTTRISKKALSIILAMLMILTSVPLVMLPASAASGTLTFSGNVTVATEARKNEKGADYFADTVWACCDGSLNNTSIGILKFTGFTNIPYGAKVTATFKMQSDPKGAANENANVAILYAKQNETWGYPGQDNTKVNWDGYSSIIGSQIVTGTQNYANVVNTYDAELIETVSLNDLGSSQKDVKIDLTQAANYAFENGKDEMTFIFAMDNNYQGDNTKGWSDTGIGTSSTIEWTTDGAYSSTGTPIDNVDSSKLDTTVTANDYGSYKDCSDNSTETDLANVYKNVLWAQKDVDSAQVLDSRVGFSGGGYCNNSFWYPTVVFLDDGVNDMQTSVVWSIHPRDCGVRVYGTWLNNSDLGVNEEWRGTDARYNFQFIWYQRDKLVNHKDFTNGATGDTIRQNFESGTSYKGNYYHNSGAASNVNNYYFANVMKVNGHLGNNELSRAISPSFKVAQSKDGNQSATFAISIIGAPTSIYIVNYVPLRNAIEEAKTAYNKYVAELATNPDKYTTASIRAFADAVNALTAAKPDNYNYSGETAATVASYETDARNALDKWAAAKNLVLSEYDVTFNLVGRDPVTVKYTWGETPAVGDGKVPAYVQQTNDTQHSTGNSWPTFEKVTSTSTSTYNETLIWVNHSYTSKITLQPTCISKGETTYTCSCGYNYTLEDVAESAHIPSDWLIDTGKDSTCTSVGEKYKKCTYCLKVLETAEIPMKDHEYEFTKTVAPTCDEDGYDLYTCKNCTATKKENPVATSGHGTLEAGTATYVGGAPASCTSSGYTGDLKCTICKKVIEYGKAINPLGHGTVADKTAELRNFEEATCGKAGYSGDLYCLRCNTVVETGVATNPTGEHTFEWVTVTPATCGTDGTKKQVCSCGAEGTTDTIPATGEHTGGEATCIAPAVCASCGQSYGTINTSNHKNTETRNATTPGCGKEGYSGDKWCLDCNTEIEKGEVIPATSQHTGGTATCKDKAVCTNCGEAYGNYAAHTEGEWKVTTPAECLKDGVKTLYCSVCNAAMKTEKIAYIGHQFVGDAVSNGNGTHSYKCTGCDLVGNGTGIYEAVVNDYDGCNYTDHYEDKDDTNHTAYCVCGQSRDVEHTWEETSSTPATCGKQGETNYECDLCEGTKTEYADATGEHTGGTATCTAKAVCTNCGQSYGDLAAHTEQTITGTPATCLAPGLTDGVKCSVCDKVITAQTEITQLSHSYTGAYFFDETTKTHRQYCVNGCNDLGEAEACTMKKTSKQDNACVEDGHITYNCDVCKQGYTTILPATGHSYSEEVVPPTCTSQGYTEYTCSECGDSYKGNYVGSIAHTYSKPSKDNLTRPTADAEGYFTLTCTCGATTTVPAERADYTAYNEAVAKLEALLETDITDEAKAAIEKALKDNKVATNLIKSDDDTLNEQPAVDTAATALESVFEDNKGDIKTYTVKFYVDGALVKTQDDILLGGSATAPADPTKATDTTNHYTFTGWDKAFDNITADLEVNAVFSETAHDYGEVTFVRNDDDTFTATRVCKSGETDTATGVVLNNTTETQPDCNNAGNTAYDVTATFANGVSISGTVNVPFGAPAHSYGDASITKRPEFIDGEWTTGEITKTCEKGDSTVVVETVNRAYYGDYDEAVKALEAILSDDTVTDTVKEEIKAVLNENKIDDNLITSTDEAFDEQDDVNNAASALNVKFEAIKAAIENETALKPDYSAAEEKLDVAEKLSGIVEDTTTVPNVKESVIKEIEDLRTALETIQKKDPEATKAVDQEAVNDIAKALDDIINGIKDGTLVDPDYKPAEDAIEAAEANKNIPEEDAKKIDEYKAALEEIKNNPDTNKNDQDDVDDIKTAVEEIVNKYAKCKDGHSYAWITDEEATCAEAGIKHEECSECHYKKNENTPILATGNHNYEWIIDTEATCAKAGIKHEECSVCHDKQNENTSIPATFKHEYNKVETDPTCTEGGYSTYTCIGCGDVYIDDPVVATGHKPETVKGYDSTCTKTGLTDGKKCSVCGITIEAQQPIPVKAHSYSTKITTPTCQTQGYTTYTCSVCGYSYNDDYKDVVDHMYAEVNDDAKAPTCTKDGLTGYKQCIWCQTKTTPVVIPATGHSWSAWTTKTPATCKAYEVQTRSCSACGETQTRDYVDGGYAEHKYTDVAGKDATCLEGGYTAHKLCSVCGDKLGYSTTTATGHSWGAWATEKPKTCTSYEIQARYCAGCNDKQTRENVDGGYADHSYKPVTGVDATCDEAGYSDHELCETCGGTKGYTEIPAKGHGDADGDGFCDHCSHDLNKPGADGCICHKNNIFSKIVRLLYTIFSKLFNKRITCCDDMEYYYDIGDIS